MELKVVELERATGKLLAHNVVDDAGRKVLRKGTPIDSEALARLRELGHSQVWIADLAPDDVPENDVARRLAGVVGGPGTEISSLSTGRANLQATRSGILKVQAEALRRINALPGVAIATRPSNVTVTPGEILSTVKIVPYALPQADLEAAESVACETAGVLSVRPFSEMRVGLLLTGSPASEERLHRMYSEVVRERVAETGSQVTAERFVPQARAAVADALRQFIDAGNDLVVICGETSIVDVGDVTPRAVEDAGGEIEIYGAPVDPGNLLMLAYVGDVSILGAPGCIRSRKANVIDRVLPRLLAGEHLTRDDVVELGHGGLLG